ncbi:MAG: aminotransferase class V-fold PLP-dependent enzyme [Ignavibacteria bacterium]|nr:aminotransferase class V-fold PLP-dependent enzyme [Ignavibacteria bacterium]
MLNNGYSDVADLWMLDKNIIFLNHGSFGACPIPILDEQIRFRKKLETEPLRYFLREYENDYLKSQSALAEFTGCDAEDLVFVQNATIGVNTVLKSLDLKPDDEILFTNQIYPACRNTIIFLNETIGVGFKEVIIKLPVTGKEEIINQILEGVNEKTKIVLLDHISSLPGMIFPVKEITEELHNRGVEILIDGAHAPGMFPLNISEVNPDYYTGNCHKWLCTPKGSALLYVKKKNQNKIHPLVTSRISLEKGRYKNDFQLEFSWQGTLDTSAVLTIPFAIEFLNSLNENGIQGLMKRNSELVYNVAEMICEEFEIPMPYPEEMTGSIYGIPFFKDDMIKSDTINQRSQLQETLFFKYNIEVMVSYWEKAPDRLLRISAQAYNTFEQYEYLISSLKNILK